MSMLFHVSSSDNRESIERHGLDSQRMGRTLGVAGSSRPEVDGVFLCRNESEVDFFCSMNANDGPVDVWAVDGVSDTELAQAQEGFIYLPGPIDPNRLTLWQSMRLPQRAMDIETDTTAFQSSLTITVSDGRVLSDAEAHEWVERGPLPEH
ncbi:MAG: hypothetical protein ACRDRL_31135 [Sciscionella sp.]